MTQRVEAGRSGAGRVGGLVVVVLALCAAPPGAAQGLRVAGRVAVMEKDNKRARDLGDAVLYLEGAGGAPPPGTFDVAIDEKVYVPRVLVVPVGSTVRFPNHDPFRHNVFSVSEPNQFDLGLYGRNEAKSQTFERPGLVRVFCNVHPRMVAYILVMGTPLYAQPAADGSFVIAGVAPGRYRLHAWHERVATEAVQEVAVAGAGVADLAITLDASGYRWQQHKNKLGQDYSSGRERY
jgi:plastocyanin